MEKETTLIIKTFQRPSCCERLVESIRRYYPEIAIVVVDDGNKHPNLSQWQNVLVIHLNFDVGVSLGRNRALQEVKTPYFVTLDDDFIFTDQTKLEKWYALLISNPDVDLVGGSVKDCAPYHGCWIWKNQDIELHIGKCKGKTRRGLEKFDITLQFFMARTKKIQPIQWDPKLKMTDHSVFFLRCKRAGVVVTYLPEVQVDHERGTSQEYHNYRYRTEFKEMAMKKLGAQNYLIIK